jgi:competence protein ComEC
MERIDQIIKERRMKLYRQRDYKSLFFLIFAVLLLIILFGLVKGPEDKVVFLDVGQGDAILLQSGTEQVLVDGGPGMDVLGRLGEEMPWFDRHIEVLVLTHPQSDHMEGLLHVFERYDVGMILLPRAVSSTQMQKVWLERIIDKEIPYRFAWSGQELVVGDLRLNILNPFDVSEAEAATRANVNNASIVMRADYGEMSFLLTGDIEKRVEKIVLEGIDSKVLNVDVLKVGHHGSKSSTTEELINIVSPQMAVISVGGDNKYGHPHNDVLNRLSDVLIMRTDQNGSVRFRLVDGKWFVS